MLRVVARERCHLVGEAEDRCSVLGGGVDRVLQRLLEQQPVGDDQVGILQHLPVAQRRLERVRVTADRDDGLDLGQPVTRHVARDVGPDARRGDDHRCVGVGTCAARRVAAARRQRRDQRRRERECGAVPSLHCGLPGQTLGSETILGVIPMTNERDPERDGVPTDRTRSGRGRVGPVRRRARARADRSHRPRLDVDGAGGGQRERQEHVAQAARRPDLPLAGSGRSAPTVSVSRSSPSSTDTIAGCR